MPQHAIWNRLQHPLLGALVIFVVAFAPLLAASPAIQTDEEEHWRHRTTFFLSALSFRHFHDTAQTEHPGITVVWLAGAAQTGFNATDQPPLALVDYMQVLRFPVKLVNALTVALGFWVLGRVFGWRLAWWAALLWATAPYLRWHMRLIHIDALTTNFMMLSFGLLLLGFGMAHADSDRNTPPVRWWALVAAGIAGGLAALTRFSSFYLLGMAGLLALINGWAWREQVNGRVFFQRMAAPVVVFTLAIAATWTALYPAMWTNPVAVYEQTLRGVDNALSNHNSFFLGQPTPSPGPAFYPVALLFRMTPFALVGVLLAVVAAVRGALRGQWRAWLAVLLYVGIYLLFLTLQSKKFDRYALTVYPALHMLAAAGWLWLAGIIRRRWSVFNRGVTRAAVGVGVAALLIGFPLLWLRAEYAYINPVAGGPRAERTLMIGGGEGLNLIGGFVDQLSDDERCGKIFASSYPHVMEHYLPCGRVWHVWHLNPVVIENADYVVNYINFRQREPRAQERLAGLTPIYTAGVNGVTFIEVYDGDAVRQANAAWLLTAAPDENSRITDDPPPTP